MFDRILFPTDGSDGASVVFDHVLDVAAANESTVHVLHVPETTFDRAAGVNEALVDERVAAAEDLVAETADRASERGVETVTAVEEGEPHRTIVEYADRHAVDVVVMPTHGRRGLERLLLGSVTERVVRRANVPVLTVRPDDDATIHYPYENVLVPTDGSDCADAALDLGTEVATATDASLHLLSVVDVASLGVDVRTGVQLDYLEENASKTLAEAANVATDAGVESVREEVGYASSIHREILAYVEDHDVDLVVVGTHGLTGFDRYLLGSVTEKLVRTASVPVLTVRGPESTGE